MFYTFRLEEWNLFISGGFQAPTGAEPSLERKRNSSPPPPSGQIPEYAPVFCKKVKTKNFYVVSSTVHQKSFKTPRLMNKFKLCPQKEFILLSKQYIVVVKITEQGWKKKTSFSHHWPYLFYVPRLLVVKTNACEFSSFYDCIFFKMLYSAIHCSS